MKTEFERIEAQNLKAGDEFKYLLSQWKVFTVSEVKFLDAEHDNSEPVGRKVLVIVGDNKHLTCLATEIVLKAKATTTVPTAVKELEFDYSIITLVYKRARKFGHNETVFQKDSGDYLTVNYEEKTLFVFHDNFPGPKRYFNHNMPILTFEQFEADLVRMKIPVPERNAEYKKVEIIPSGNPFEPNKPVSVKQII